MRQQIINILEKYSIKNSDITGDWNVLEDDMLPQVAEEIEKLYTYYVVERNYEDCLDQISIGLDSYKEAVKFRDSDYSKKSYPYAYIIQTLKHKEG